MAIQQLEPLYQGTVTIHGGAGPEGETHRNVRITTFGPTAKLMILDPDRNRGVTHDTLTNVSVEREPDGKIRFVGVSDVLRNEMQLAEANASVTWLLTPRGCKSCH